MKRFKRSVRSNLLNCLKTLPLVLPMACLMNATPILAGDKGIQSSYQLSTFLSMAPGSDFAQKFCPSVSGIKTCAVEGSAMGHDGSLYLAMALPKGKIVKVMPDGTASIYASFPIGNADPTAVDFNGVNLRIAIDNNGDLYVPFISVTDTFSKTATAYTGIWKIPAGGGNCDLTSGPCTKIWPQNVQSLVPHLRFPDGVALDGKGNIYVSDSQMGNIWKVDISTGNGVLWAGVDAGSNPNYLAGNPADFLLNSPDGRGLGNVGLTIDDKAQNLYGANFDKGMVVRMPINTDGTAGQQQVILDLSAQDRQLDAIYFDKKANILYVTEDQDGFMAFVNTLGCFIQGTCQLQFFQDGHKVLAADMSNVGDYSAVTFHTVINDPIIGVTTGVVAGKGDEKSSLYIDVFSSTDGSGPKVVRAVPSDK